MTFSEIAVLVTDIHINHFNLQANPVIPILVVDGVSGSKSYLQYISNSAKFRGIKDIKVFRVDYRQNFILGRFQMYGDKADILISVDENNCWSRYVAAKEMTHIIIDKTKESMTTDIDRTINWILKQGMDVNIHASLDSEHIAAQFAAELLVPYHISKPMLENQAMTSYQIAAYFGVPERIIDTFRDPGYLSLRDEAYKDL